NGLEHPRVGRRVAAPRSLDRGQIDHHDPITYPQGPHDEAALSGSGDTRDDGEHTQGHIDVDTAQVVRLCAADLERPRRFPDRVLELSDVSEVATGERIGLPQTADGAGEGDLSPVAARTGTEVDDVVGDADR